MSDYMKNRLRSERGQRAILEATRTAPGGDDNHPDSDGESGGGDCEATETTEAPPLVSSEPALDVSPVGRRVRRRQQAVKLSLDDRLDVNHNRTPSSLAR